MKKVLGIHSRIDHVAIAVRDMEQALVFYRDVLGLDVKQERTITGTTTGMRSAELDAGGFSLVLVQGTDPASQVSRYIDEYGPGVQHLAVEVDDVEQLADRLRATGLRFATDVIRGKGLIQIFSQRDANSGMMFEFIARPTGDTGFEPNNIQKLFDQLEANEAY